MARYLNVAVSLSLVLLLPACGGGGGDNSAGGGSAEYAGPLAKYVGTYSYCDRDHTRYAVTMRGTDTEALAASYSEVTYRNADCTGAVLGDYKWVSPVMVTFASAGIVTVSAQGLPSSLTVDKVSTQVDTVATLSGSGVSGNCVTYPNGEICYDMTIREQTEAALYLSSSGSTLYSLSIENGVYSADGIYERQ